MACDVDGVLTDGGIYVDASGREVFKHFHVLDGMAVVKARENGLRVAWISGRQSPAVTARAADLGIPYVFQGVPDKKEVLARIQEMEGLGIQETAYIGDDTNDLSAFERAQVKVAVATAHPDLKARANWVLATAGGRGALREVVDTVVAAKAK
ncbi:MAG: KdsC family phosphatase [bacterium JZ-2024 1]